MPVPSITSLVFVMAGLRLSGFLRIFVGHESGRVSGVMTVGFTNGSLLYLLGLSSALVSDCAQEPRLTKTNSERK